MLLVNRQFDFFGDAVHAGPDLRRARTGCKNGAELRDGGDRWVADAPGDDLVFDNLVVRVVRRRFECRFLAGTRQGRSAFRNDDSSGDLLHFDFAGNVVVSTVAVTFAFLFFVAVSFPEESIVATDVSPVTLHVIGF